MNTRTKAVAYGITALALAGLVIFSGSTLGLFPLTNSSLNPSSSAVLSILLTDPPSVPAGVTAVYVNYSSLAVHLAGLGDAGWVSTGAKGVIETLGLVNLTQTISSGSVPAGSYNMIRLGIAGVDVTYGGKNYSATVSSGKLDITIVGGLKLNSSSDSAAVIDIRPTVLNLGNQTDPQFVVTTGAKALQVPSGEFKPEMGNVGFRSSLPQKGWFKSFAASHSDNLTAGSASLSASSFKVTLTNPTSDSVTIRMIIVTSAAAGTSPSSALDMLSDSVVFAVDSNGTIQLVTQRAGDGSGVGQVRSLLGGNGFQLNSGSSVTFTFTGSISSFSPGLAIASGTSYNVLVVGEHLLITTTVVAS